MRDRHVRGDRRGKERLKIIITHGTHDIFLLVKVYVLYQMLNFIGL